MDVPPDLVRAAQSGDRQAMEDLVLRSYRPAYTLALRLMGNPEDAAEATQEAYLRVFRSLKGFREVGAFPTWLFRIVSNVCLTEMRRRARREVPAAFELAPERDPSDVEGEATDRAFRAELGRCLRELPDAYRMVIVLRDVYGFSGEETAEVLGISAGAVKVRLHRARRRLRDHLVARFPDWGREGGGTPEERKRASA